MASSRYLFTDAKTLESFGEKDPGRVLLLGSYFGYSNFGDILQLKGAIQFHKKSTGLRPVVICDLLSYTGVGFIDNVRRWFDVEDVLFISDEPFDVAHLNLKPLQEALPIPHLHLYGGGFLNSYWGEAYIKSCEFLMTVFQVEHYVVSGQQLDPDFAPALKAHFERFPPVIVGGRDALSADIIRESGLPGGFSFDDALEVLLSWVSHKPPQGASLTSRLLLHLNTSSYTGAPAPTLFLERVKRLAERTPSVHAPILLQAYDDVRLLIKDTLPSVIALDGDFPYAHYEVLDLAQLALLLDPAAPAPQASYLNRLDGGVALSSSYHVGMFLNLQGVPCFVQASNPYYVQKVGGLGFHTSFESFLADPQPISYAAKIEARQAWMKELAEAYAGQLPAVARPSAVRLAFPEERVLFRVKHDVLSLTEALHADLVDKHHRLSAQVAALEEGLSHSGSLAAWLKRKFRSLAARLS